MAAPPSGSCGAAAAPFRTVLRPLAPLFAIDILTAFTVGMVPPLLPLLADEWRLSPLQVGLVNTLYAVGRLATSYPASALRAYRGTRTVVFLGLALLVGGVMACGFAPGFPAFLLARLVMGIGASAAFLAIFAELLETTPAAWRGRLTNLFEGMAILSLAIGSTLGAWVAGLFSWRWVFVGAGPIGLALSAGYAAELAGLLGVGLIIDRVRREPVFCAGAASVALGGLILAAGLQPAVFVLGLVLVGAGFAVWMVPAIVMADRVGTPMAPGYFAVYRIAMDSGMIVGPLALGAVADLVGGRAAVGGAGLALVAGAVALAIGRR